MKEIPVELSPCLRCGKLTANRKKECTECLNKQSQPIVERAIIKALSSFRTGIVVRDGVSGGVFRLGRASHKFRSNQSHRAGGGIRIIRKGVS